MKITRNTLRRIVKNARCSDCGTANPDAMAIVDETIICANCHQAKAFA
jgi:formylmethanofuran dehydrogenase subunit E